MWKPAATGVTSKVFSPSQDSSNRALSSSTFVSTLRRALSRRHEYSRRAARVNPRWKLDNVRRATNFSTPFDRFPLQLCCRRDFILCSSTQLFPLRTEAHNADRILTTGRVNRGPERVNGTIAQNFSRTGHDLFAAAVACCSPLDSVATRGC